MITNFVFLWFVQDASYCPSSMLYRTDQVVHGTQVKTSTVKPLLIPFSTKTVNNANNYYDRYHKLKLMEEHAFLGCKELEIRINLEETT